jgi:hypothetical protein
MKTRRRCDDGRFGRSVGIPDLGQSRDPFGQPFAARFPAEDDEPKGSEDVVRPQGGEAGYRRHDRDVAIMDPRR